MLRAASPDDYPLLIDIWLAASIRAYPFLPPNYWPLQRHTLYRDYLPRGQTWLWEDYGRPAGFICVVDNFVVALYVHPLYQGQGIGTRLLQQVKRQRPQLGALVYANNQAAYSFFLQQGFIHQHSQQDERHQQLEWCLHWPQA